MKVYNFNMKFLTVFNRNRENISSPHLPDVITSMRRDTDLPIALRASLVYRGLPVTRASKNQM